MPARTDALARALAPYASMAGALGVAWLLFAVSLTAGAASARAAKANRASLHAAARATQASGVTPAFRDRKRLIVLSTSAAQPIAGETYTMTFAIIRGDEYFHIARFGCYARTKAGTIPLAEQGGGGYVAHCSWMIPRTASGLTLNGIAGPPRRQRPPVVPGVPGSD